MDKEYITVQGDMWDSIAYRLYGHERHMGVLMRANPELLDIFIFSAGTVLSVPELEVKADAEKPAWR